MSVGGGQVFGWQFQYGLTPLPPPPPGGGNEEDLLPATTLNIAGVLVTIAGVYVVMT